MASFYAELEVTGHTYPVRVCQFSFTQATDERGRVRGKVRHGLVHLALDTPQDDFLLNWGTTINKPLAGHVTFFETNQRTARETMSFAAGECVGYHETFDAGDGGAGAYISHLTIAASKLVLSAGGPLRAVVAAKAQEYATLLPAAIIAAPSEQEIKKQKDAAKKVRYNARMNLIQRAQNELSNVSNQEFQNALHRLQRDNVAVERARLSAHAYNSDKLPPLKEEDKVPDGWQMLDSEELSEMKVSPEMLIDPASGFKAAIYRSSFEEPSKLVIAYAGTEPGSEKSDILAGVKESMSPIDNFMQKGMDSMGLGIPYMLTKMVVADKFSLHVAADIMADLRQGIGQEEKQYNQAMKLADIVAKSKGKDDIETTGHSLGGGLSSAATVSTGAKGYTFNAAGLHINTINSYANSQTEMQKKKSLLGIIKGYATSWKAMKNRASLIDAYHSSSDPLNRAQNFLDAPMGVIAPKALGTAHVVTPTNQHSWSELVKGNPLTALGKMALDGHGMTQMVDSIEAEKDVDRKILEKYLSDKASPALSLGQP